MEPWREELYQDLYIEHHGIQGQKWGVRNGPPYPLRGGDYSYSEKQAIKRNKKVEWLNLTKVRNNNSI